MPEVDRQLSHTYVHKHVHTQTQTLRRQRLHLSVAPWILGSSRVKRIYFCLEKVARQTVWKIREKPQMTNTRDQRGHSSLLGSIGRENCNKKLFKMLREAATLPYSSKKTHSYRWCS